MNTLSLSQMALNRFLNSVDEYSQDNPLYFLEKRIVNPQSSSFIGGSKRFGYDNFASDLDIFILPDSAGDFHVFKNFFEDTGWIIAVNRYKFQRSTHYRKVGETMDCILFLPDLEGTDAFNKLRADHDDVEEYLADNPGILHFLKVSKNMYNEMYRKGDGKYIFKTLLRMSRS